MQDAVSTAVPISRALRDGIHSFFIGKNSRVKYVEKHYGTGDGKGQRIMNPETIIEVGENSYMEMDTAQIKGVDSTIRKTPQNWRTTPALRLWKD